MAYFAPQLLPALIGSGAFAAAVTTAVVSLALSVAVSTAVGLVVGKPTAAGAATPSVFRQSLASSFIVYGKRRVGGLLMFFHPRTVGKDYYRYFVIAVAGHQCKGVTRWFLGDDQVFVDANGMVTSGTYANNAWLWFYRGTDDQQAHPVFVAETAGKWTAAHRARGTALIYAKFKMTDAVVQAGMPNITAEIEGKDTIFDPRDDSVGYTNNAQLVFRDWLALPREEGGFGAYPDELDDDWDALNAGVCDEDVPVPTGTEKRYAFDAYITTGSAPSEVRDTFVTCCAGAFTYSGGKMLMRPGYYVPPSATLQEDDLAGSINVPALLAGDEIATEVTGTFIDPAALYQPGDVPTRAVSSDDVRQTSADLPHVTSPYRGQRILEYLLRKAQAERRVTWPMNIAGLAVSTLDTVQLATSRYGLSNYSFQTTGWGLSQDFSVVLQLEEHSPELFEFTPDMYLAPGQVAIPTRADPISDTPNRAAHLLLAQTVAYPVTSDDDSIIIAPFTGTVDDGRVFGFPAGEIDGLTSGTNYLILWNTATSAYEVAPSPGTAKMASSDYIYIATYATSNAGVYPSQETPPGGYVSGGGGSSCPEVGELILLSNKAKDGPGDTIAAGQLEAGMWVWSQHETTKVWGAYQVTFTRVFTDQLWAADGLPTATAAHLFWTDGGWRRMDTLGKPSVVGRAVAITVADAHTYVLMNNGEQHLSHNKVAQTAD